MARVSSWEPAADHSRRCHGWSEFPEPFAALCRGKLANGRSAAITSPPFGRSLNTRRLVAAGWQPERVSAFRAVLHM
jgi:hypothetical protein